MKGFSIFGFMWGTPRESKTSTRESRAKASRKECVKVEPRKQRRKQVHSRSAFKYSCAPLFTGNFPRKQLRKILRNTCHRNSQNCARERTAKPSRKLIRIRTKSLPGFRRRSIEISEQERRCFGLRIFFGIGSV